MPVTSLSSLRFGHFTPVSQPSAPAIRFGHAPADNMQVRFAGKDHKPFEVVQAYNILGDVASAFAENPDVLYPRGFNLSQHVNKGFYSGSHIDPYPGSIRLGNTLMGSGRPTSLFLAYQRWVEQAMAVDKENIMMERDGECIPFNRLFDIQAALPDGRKVRLTQTVDVDQSAMERLKGRERVHEGLGGRELRITVTRGKDTLDDIVLKSPHHVDDLSLGMERLLEAYIDWRPGASITPEIRGTVGDIVEKSLRAQAECVECACKEDK